ncbi:hypothetical protein Misp01_32480 [Microtetraspora sp. NBRC 13810]|nr:hypothetical protein Misp01_32480 [Microtetraspora sp. NBRC 13810]
MAVAAPEPVPVPVPVPVMIVLDASGSMRAEAGGRSKMAAAKDAVDALVSRAPEGARLGLTVYGTGTGSAPAEKARGCEDVRVVRPVGTDPRAIGRAVRDIRPSGYTPIGQALRVAAAALPAEGPRSIVLVSDGEDTCAPPEPCEVAEELAGQGVDLRVHTVGFDVDAATRRQLTCVARATGGTYTDAPDAADLSAALGQAGARALRDYDPAGTPVEGGADPATATPLRPGAHLDRLGPGQAKYYSVEVPAGYTAYATASLILPLRRSELLRITRYAAEGTECVWSQEVKHAAGFVGSAVMSWPVRRDPAGAPVCERPGRQVLRVERLGTTAVEEGPLELLFGLEPPLLDRPSPAPPAPSTPPVTFTEPAGQPRRVLGGGSFGAAATLDGSGVYTDTVQYGEIVFYRVWVGWGQGLAYRVRFPDSPGRAATIVRATTYNPLRDELRWDHEVYGESPVKLPRGSDAIITYPVHYDNRRSFVRDPYRLPGWYYIAVGNGQERDREDAGSAEMRLEVSVAGDPEPGPRYAAVPADILGSAPASPPASPGASPPASPGASAPPSGREPASGGPASREPAPPPPPADAAAGPLSLVSGAGPAVWAGVPTALAVAVLLTVLLVRRRRR